MSIQLLQQFDDLKAIIKNLCPDFPDSLLGLANETEGAAKLARELPKYFAPIDVSVEHRGGQLIWEFFGKYYFDNRRFYEAALLFSRLYDHLLLYQESSGKRCHKGAPLFWFGDCHLSLGNKVIATVSILHPPRACVFFFGFTMRCPPAWFICDRSEFAH